MPEYQKQHSPPGTLTPSLMHDFTAPPAGSPNAVGGWAGDLNEKQQIHNDYTGVDYAPDPDKPPIEYDRYSDNAGLLLGKQEEKTPLVHPEGGLTGAQLPYPAFQSGMQAVHSNPRTQPELVSLPVRQPAAGSFGFWRQFGQQVSHYFNGLHMSGADPQTVKQVSVALIGGMAPARQIRNTYRIAPPLAATLQVDEPIPVAVQGNPYPDLNQVFSSRSWRLP